MFDIEQAKIVFITESTELLLSMESALLELEEHPNDPELINQIFRAIHTIKGSAGIFEFGDVIHFTHDIENALDLARSGQLQLDNGWIRFLLSSCDHLTHLIDASCNHEDLSALNQTGEQLLQQLQQLHPTATQTSEPSSATESSNNAIDNPVQNSHWHLSLRFGPNTLRCGMDPMATLGYLAEVGQILQIIPIVEYPDNWHQFDPLNNYIGLEIKLDTTLDKTELQDIFEFYCEEDADIRLFPPHSELARYAELIEQHGHESDKLGEILCQCGALTQQELQRALHDQTMQNDQIEDGHPRKIGEILVEKGMVQPSTVQQAVSKQATLKEHKRKESNLLKVDAQKLDQLINLVGELVIAGAGTHVLAKTANHSALIESSAVILRLIEDIRDQSLQLRMIKIDDTFRRFKRIVHDIGDSLGKKIQLDIKGGDTELDKTLVDKISDPLTHLIRNAIDHGIETPEVRQAKGKTAEGTIQLNAYHDSGCIVIEISDDGSGINIEKVKQKALQTGLLHEGARISEQEILQFIFEAGLSTHDQANQISGRGVGMDVVKRNVEELRGHIDIETQPDQGTRFKIRLPLSLSIIDGFMVGVGQSTYVLPLDMVHECVELTQNQRAQHHGNYINLRGEVLPFLDLRSFFNETSGQSQRENLVIVQFGPLKAGLVVDKLLGEFQTVIKPLSVLLASVAGLSGSTILGTGEVAMILDVPALIERAIQHQQIKKTA